MAQVTLTIGSRNYGISCQDGEEAHISKLADLVDAKVREVGDASGLTETRMLLFGALMLADELDTARQEAEKAAVSADMAAPPANAGLDDTTLRAIEGLAERAEQLATALEQGPSAA